MSRKRLYVLLAIVALAAFGALAFWLSRPQQVAALVLGATSRALGLDITASGVAEYRLRGIPTLVLRDLDARLPGATTPLLQADRAWLSLPWHTLRSRGDDLTLQRIELDGPRLQWPALVAWLDARPPSDTPLRLPVLTDGVQVRDGHVDGDGWALHGLALDAPRFHPTRPLSATVRGDYLDPPSRARFDLAVELGQTQALLDGEPTPLQLSGTLAADLDGKRVPATIALSGPVQREAGTVTIAPMRFGTSARYEADATRLPFLLGMHGRLQLDGDGLLIAPDALVLNGTDDASPIPSLQAQGQLALRPGKAPLALSLDGRLAGWPEAWPTLPPPLGQSRAPLPFSLRYAGHFDASSPARLRLEREQTRFDARFRLPAVLDWLDAIATGTPLPPIDGRLQAPEIEVAGATLRGVELSFESDEAE
ncbi:hypothetical protein [Marilutibacter aestuarii]|uniref:AsmA family protein n=1 Tax=Marilutibacter aestuarii TaxID=1706195 RepID=A0A507ZYR5_9GAMM|nr:hypothetical protein [Lysobacter aestuarii]TQD41354.1 hypothetical protein FKV25_12905 [Lysobacter aestuarii]